MDDRLENLVGFVTEERAKEARRLKMNEKGTLQHWWQSLVNQLNEQDHGSMAAEPTHIAGKDYVIRTTVSAFLSGLPALLAGKGERGGYSNATALMLRDAICRRTGWPDVSPERRPDSTDAHQKPKRYELLLSEPLSTVRFGNVRLDSHLKALAEFRDDDSVWVTTDQLKAFWHCILYQDTFWPELRRSMERGLRALVQI